MKIVSTISFLIFFHCIGLTQIIESNDKIILSHPSSDKREINGVSHPIEENDALNLLSLLTGSINFANATGANDSITLNLQINPSSLTAGMLFNFISPITNTRSTFIKFSNSSTYFRIKKKGTENLDTSDIQTNQLVSLIFDGTNFQIISQLNRSCPTGFIKVTEEYCITPNESDSIYFWPAVKNCGDQNARVCNWGEWYYACLNRTSLGINGMIGNYEWVDGGGNSTSSSSSTGLMSGSTGCQDIDSGIVDPTILTTRSLPKSYRCCYSLRKND